MTSSDRSDRSVQRTRALLQNALSELILEQGYEQITVQDLLDRADVGRSTFYHHYQSKDELLLSGMDELRAVLTARTSSETDSASLMAPLWPLFEHAATHRHLFRAVLGSRANNFAFRAGRRMLADTLTPHLRTRLDITDQHRLDMLVAFLVNGLVGLITWWLDTRPQLPAEQVYADFEKLATEGVRAFSTAS